MRQNRLKVNPEKTHLLTVGTSTRVDQLMSSIEVKMDGIQLKENPEKSEQLQGIQLEYNLKWNRTFEHLKLKLKKRIAGLAKLKFIMTLPLLKTNSRCAIIWNRRDNTAKKILLSLLLAIDKKSYSGLSFLSNTKRIGVTSTRFLPRCRKV